MASNVVCIEINVSVLCMCLTVVKIYSIHWSREDKHDGVYTRLLNPYRPALIDFDLGEKEKKLWHVFSCSSQMVDLMDLDRICSF